MAGRRTGKIDSGTMVVIDPEEANRSVGFIHRKAMELIERLAKVQLWPQAGEENQHAKQHHGDPPMLQMLFRMRDQFNAIPEDEVAERNKILRSMNVLAKDLNDVASDTAKTLVESLWRLKAMEQAEAHHQDKMRLEQAKLAPDRPPTTSELIQSARRIRDVVGGPASE